MGLTVVFRADASIQIGTGHLIRCLTLADSLRQQGHRCQFICRAHEGHMGDYISSRGYKVSLLSDAPEIQGDFLNDTSDAHSSWLKAPMCLDAEQTLEVISALKVDWLIVDHYSLDSRWEKVFCNVVKHIFVIDDLANRDHIADVLLDQNVLSRDIESRYRTRSDSECRFLLGPKFALLGNEYGILANALPQRTGQISRVLVFVGGSDPHGLTERYLMALSAPEFSHLSVDVVVGKNHPNVNGIAELVRSRRGANIYSGLSTLAVMMVRADLMLGAGGTTNWERMCLGLNSIVVSVACNQQVINQELSQKGLIHLLGNVDVVSVNRIQSVVSNVIGDEVSNSDQSRAMRQYVDGLGTERVVNILQEPITNAIT